MVPATHYSSIRNAARLAPFALAAYHQKSFDQDCFREYIGTGECRWWLCGNASGLTYQDDERIVIAIAGTNDRLDRVNDIDILEQDFGDWSQAWSIPIHDDVRNTSSTAGFLAYSGLCYAGIDDKITNHDSRTVWIAGHSLGGAAAQVLQCTKRFEGCRVCVYGCPRVFRGNAPEQIRVSVRRITDPVVYGPSRFAHASCETFWVRYPGGVRSKIPVRYKPLAVAYKTLVWTKGLAQSLLMSLGVPIRSTFYAGHSMIRYKSDLWSLR